MSQLLQALGSRALPDPRDAIAAARVRPEPSSPTLLKVGGLAALVAGAGYVLTRGAKKPRRSR